ncbi:MAG: hypothetical protein ACOC5L_03545 [Halobacteriota archaeon]
MFPENIVASDATKNDRGNFFNLIGVAIEFNNYSKFREKYFDAVNDISEKYDVFLPKIVKAKDVLNYVPSFDIRDCIKELVTELLNLEYISKIQVTETFIDGEIEMWYQGSLQKVPASQFIRNELSQTYSLVPIWKYILNCDADIKTSFAIDNVTGRINKLWKTIGKTAEVLNLVPYGDQTHPCISLCDLLCDYIKREIFPQKAAEIREHLRDNFDVHIKSDPVGNHDVDSMTPRYPYPIRSENHFPHPIVFIKSKEIRDRTVLGQSELFKRALQYAEKKGGCVTLPDIVNHQKILQKGDIVICTDKESYREMSNIIALNKDKGLELLNLDEGYEFLEK